MGPLPSKWSSKNEVDDSSPLGGGGRGVDLSEHLIQGMGEKPIQSGESEPGPHRAREVQPLMTKA